MDIRCPNCGEPWDMDSLHDTAYETFDEARKAFYKKGCIVFDTKCPEQANRPMAAMAAEALYDLLGDDIDGAAAMLEDFEYAGGFDV